MVRSFTSCQECVGSAEIVWLDGSSIQDSGRFPVVGISGHVVESGVLRPDESKTKKILLVSTPATKKQVRSLLGLLSFYRRYIPGFASVAVPLTDLTKEGGRSCRSIHWTPD